jgi:SpoVK/Ycf46/Vps4 family AAA+-type ATPase
LGVDNLPVKEARHEILKIVLREEALDADVKLEELAERTERFSGSDLKSVWLR